MKKWRVAHILNDEKSYADFTLWFEQAYKANGNPKDMAMFSHTDSLGQLAAVSITPAAMAYCPFSADWEERSEPFVFGHVGWVAGDPRYK
jgi:hypothetical protein